MQLLGKDTIIESYADPDGHLLHRTASGFQYGHGKDRQIITDPAQVSTFSSAIQEMVKTWINQHGVFEAQKDVMDRDIVEEATSQPGTLEAKVKRLGQDFYAHLSQLVDNALRLTAGGSSAPPSPEPHTDGVHEYVDGKPVVVDAHGFKHPLPDPELVKHPKIIQTEGGILLDKGNGHKEFRLGEDAEAQDDLAEEKSRIAEQEGRTASRHRGQGGRFVAN